MKTLKEIYLSHIKNDFPDKDHGFIYAIVHPNTREVRYIGQTTKSLDYRLRTHINSSILKDSNESRTPIGKWILKLIKIGIRPEILLVKQVPIISLNTAEIKYIKLGRIRYRLLNIANGGRIEGRKKGSKQTKEFCERQSILRSGKKNQNFKDLTGINFNNLVVLSLEKFEKNRSWWLCKCICSNTKIVPSNKLGRVKSCGCAKKLRWNKKERDRLSNYNKLYRKINPETGRLLPYENT